ncbi:MAG: hypothetical protein RL385_1779 [Pseudomonadota bacterium]
MDQHHYSTPVSRTLAVRPSDDSVSFSATVNITEGLAHLAMTGGGGGTVEVGIRVRATVDGGPLPGCADRYFKLAKQTVPFVAIGTFAEGAPGGPFTIPGCVSSIPLGSRNITVEVLAESYIALFAGQATASLRGDGHGGRSLELLSQPRRRSRWQQRGQRL